MAVNARQPATGLFYELVANDTQTLLNNPVRNT